MKKTYIIPELIICKVHGQTILTGSETLNLYEEGGTEDLVKSDRTSSRYNVWDDDWSN